jgi:hypothetical protein
VLATPPGRSPTPWTPWSSTETPSWPPRSPAGSASPAVPPRLPGTRHPRGSRTPVRAATRSWPVPHDHAVDGRGGHPAAPAPCSPRRHARQWFVFGLGGRGGRCGRPLRAARRCCPVRAWACACGLIRDRGGWGTARGTGAQGATGRSTSSTATAEITICGWPFSGAAATKTAGRVPVEFMVSAAAPGDTADGAVRTPRRQTQKGLDHEKSRAHNGAYRRQSNGNAEFREPGRSSFVSLSKSPSG